MSTTYSFIETNTLLRRQPNGLDSINRFSKFANRINSMVKLTFNVPNRTLTSTLIYKSKYFATLFFLAQKKILCLTRLNKDVVIW